MVIYFKKQEEKHLLFSMWKLVTKIKTLDMCLVLCKFEFDCDQLGEEEKLVARTLLF